MNLYQTEYLKQCYSQTEQLFLIIGYFSDLVVTDKRKVPFLIQNQKFAQYIEIEAYPQSVKVSYSILFIHYWRLYVSKLLIFVPPHPYLQHPTNRKSKNFLWSSKWCSITSETMRQWKETDGRMYTVSYTKKTIWKLIY